MALSSIPSSSSPSNTCQFMYDVFLSFRGEDNRNNFTSHLHEALLGKKIEAFIDYKLNSGDEISPSLLKAIEESRISIVVFSDDYASSRWCLEELVKILECRKNHRKIVIPVFYGIDPSHVRNQSGNFAVALANHQQRAKRVSLDQGQRWKDALKEAANLSGFDSGVYKNECELIEAIVQYVSKRLNDQLPSTDTSSHLVEIHSRFKEIDSLLCLGSEDVFSVGIWGIGGIGKTIAPTVFKRISCQFDGPHFIENVDEELEHWWCGLNRLRQELPLGADPRNRLGRKKVFTVLDDVSNPRKIKSLIQDFNFFNRQSRIGLTTRDKQVLWTESALESDHGSNTALHLASDQGNLTRARSLIKSHPQLCLMKNEDKRIPLQIAVIRGRYSLVSELLKACPESIMEVSATEETPLHAAIRQWQETFLELLIESVQKRSEYVHLINKKDCAGNRQQFQTIRLLPSDKPSCNGKVDVNALNEDGFTGLDNLNVLPHEGKRDREIEMIRQRGGALRARGSSNVKFYISNNVKRIESQRNRDQSSYLQANWPLKTKHNTPRDAYHALLITAAVILAITFYAALIAPGKLVDNIKYKSSSSLGFQVGKQSSNYLLRLFIWFDSIAFITSAASMIIIIMHEIPLKPWMLISVLSIYGAYICLIRAVSPRDALPVFLLGSPTILLASMSKHLALHSTLLKLLQFLWFRVYKS